MTISPPAERSVSAPKFLTGPSGSSAAAEEAVELAQVAGLHLDAWQVEALRLGLAEGPNRKWAALEVALIVPRQNGKGAVLEAVELAGLYLFGEKLILHSAHEFKTASEAFRRIWSLIEQTPELDRMVFRKLQNNNDMSIELKSGQRLRFLARSGASGRGFSGDRVILDEAYKLPDQMIAAMAPTLSARPNPQIWYTSSAPLPSLDSDVLRRICLRGREGSPRLAYVEYCAESDADLDDVEAWYQANPALDVNRPDGSGLSSEYIAGVERPLYTAEDFARERLGIWGTDYERKRIIPAEDWSACEDMRSQPLEPVFVAIDVARDSVSASIGIAGMRPDGRVHVEAIENRAGAGWVVERTAAICRKHGIKEVTLTPNGPAGALANGLGLAGLEVVTCSAQESQQACAAFLNGIMERRYVHLGQGWLNLAVDSAERRESGDAWVWDRRSSAADVTPLIAVTLAAWSLHRYLPEADSKVFASWR